MKHNRPSARLLLLRHGVAAAAVFGSVVACTVTRDPVDEPIATSSSALWTNGGFETGNAGQAPAAPWTVQTFINPGITVQNPQTFAGLNLQNGGAAHTVILASAAGPGSQMDPDLGAAGSLRWPRYGNQCAIVNQHGNNRNVNVLSQTMTVAPGDVDPIDGQVHVRFTVAPVLQNPAHTAVEQPYYFVILTDKTKGTTLYSDFNLSGAGIPWKKINAGTANEIDYTDWQLIDISGGGGAIAQGDSVEIQIIGAGCSLGAHWGEIYVDGVGSGIPGLSIEGTGPAQANAGTNVTYTFTYRNGSASAETGVVVDVTTPTNTTYQAITPPAGATCVTPAVGAAGTVTCTFTGPVAAGASGTFTVTVQIAAAATGTIVESSYDIHSTQETALDGPPIVTLVGCTQDAQCTSGNWCDETTHQCSPTLPNGQPVPSDPAHMNPTLNGTCTAQAGALVCTSGVCDTTDNKCGYANGDGPCTMANGGTVCRSGACSTNGTCEPSGGCNVDADCAAGNWCDESMHQCTPTLANGQPVPSDPSHMNPTLDGTCTGQAGALVCTSGVCDTTDNKCGYANGDGPCTMANGGTVCRSGMCSSTGTCEPGGGCNVDSDCSAGKWCDESMNQCMPKLANGQPIPTDAPHMNPTLDGTCTSQAGALVCVSAVCDTSDSKCGYANGDGPCTMANGGTVCRSGMCSTSGVCEPSGGCEVNQDCPGSMPICNPTTHMCEPGPDAGAPDAGVDSGRPTDGGGAVDASNDAASTQGDAGSSGDAATSNDAAEEAVGPDATIPTGYVEGGGLSCALAPRGSSGTFGGVMAALWVLGLRRRRARIAGSANRNG